MKFVLAFCFFVLLLGMAVATNVEKPTKQTSRTQTQVKVAQHTTITTTNTPPISKLTQMLFIPYWTVSKKNIDDSLYDTDVYFGITADNNGIDTTEPGYAAVDTFLSSTNPAKRRLLAVRMIDSNINVQVLHDKSLQATIINQSIQMAKEKGFKGIVLDFEISALGFSNITKEITDFETKFAQSVKQQNLQFFATIYGDTFFRDRPFDVQSIAKVSDGIMIMTYDFHKANGDPGPNFQLHDSQNDGYDMVQMLQQFKSEFPLQKATIVFGMYGYDWQIDDKENSVKTATSVSDNDVKQKFLDACNFKNCKIVHDIQSKETKITYTDGDNNNHIVWFEDMNSVNKKTEFLKSQGINSIAYWAYSYF